MFQKGTRKLSEGVRTSFQKEFLAKGYTPDRRLRIVKNPVRVSIFLKSDQKFKVKFKVKSKVKSEFKSNFFSSHFTATLFLKFKLNVNSNENESKNASGGACARGAKRPRVGVLPRCVFAFVFV